MSKGTLNKVIIIGNLGDDPVMRYTPDGKAIANIKVATTESWKGKDGEKKEATEWHKIVCFNTLAKIVGEYLGKGSKVYFEGRLQTRKWQNKEGKDQYTTEIVADKMEMLGGKSKEVARHAETAGSVFPGETDPLLTEGDKVESDFSDDIPFN